MTPLADEVSALKESMVQAELARLPDHIIRDAEISECGQYRYSLIRVWDTKTPCLMFVMLNPSKADHRIDDATIRRCIYFAKREGCGGILVVNMFAFRTTYPSELRKASAPIGPKNDKTLRDYAKIASASGTAMIAGWGVNAPKNREADVVRIIREAGAEIICFGTTKDGHPNHPLYMSNDRSFELFFYES